MGRRLQSQPEGLRKFVEGRCPEAQKAKKVTLTRARTSSRQIHVKESYRGLANCGPEIADPSETEFTMQKVFPVVGTFGRAWGRVSSSLCSAKGHLETQLGSLHCSLVCCSSGAIRIALGYHQREREEGKLEGEVKELGKETACVRDRLKIRNPHRVTLQQHPDTN